MEFISREANAFPMETLAKLTQLAAIVAIALENVLDKERTLEQANSLRLERDSCKILVDVTNAVIKLVRIAELPQSLFTILHHHVGISSLCLAEYNATSDSFKSYLVNQQQREQPGIINHSCFEKNCLQGALGHSEPFFLYREQGHGCQSSCRFTSQILPPDADSSCILPLRYRGNLLGVLILSHPQADFFADLDISLLEQVAARTAIAMNNVQAQQEISNTTGAREKTLRVDGPAPQGDFANIIYQSAVMEKVLEKVKLVAQSDCTVLILGETGTGKELIAQAIHALSARHDHEMVKVNCAAIPTGLIESDLFGHEKGAFTGALTQRIGRFERAHKGTLFLDEVGDMPLDLQPKLLRVLQEHAQYPSRFGFEQGPQGAPLRFGPFGHLAVDEDRIDRDMGVAEKVDISHPLTAAHVTGQRGQIRGHYDGHDVIVLAIDVVLQLQGGALHYAWLPVGFDLDHEG